MVLEGARQEIEGLAAVDEVMFGSDAMRAGIGAWRGREECKNAPPHHMQHPARPYSL